MAHHVERLVLDSQVLLALRRVALVDATLGPELTWVPFRDALGFGALRVRLPDVIEELLGRVVPARDQVTLIGRCFGFLYGRYMVSERSDRTMEIVKRVLTIARTCARAMSLTSTHNQTLFTGSTFPVKMPYI